MWEKRESGMVTQSEESMTLMTFYGFPHHGSRSFACVPDDALPAPSLRVQILRLRSGWGLAISVAFAGKSKRKAMMGFLESEVQFH